MAKRAKKSRKVEALTHEEATRKNIPTAELQSAAQRAEEIAPVEPVSYSRTYPLPKGEKHERDTDLDPQIVWNGATLHLTPDQVAELNRSGKIEIGDAHLAWRGKDTQDWSDLVVQAPPLYIQEKIHPKALIEDLKRQSAKRAKDETDAPELFDMYKDFNGLDPDMKAEFYQHDQNWQNRMILGDSLQVMASLAEREGLRGKVQCIYYDPPYGVKFGSNWQVSTRSRNVKDGERDQVTREPEMVRAFRDTWKDEVHSYLTHLRDRFTTAHDLLHDGGSIFVQISDENVHRVRAILDEIFGEKNFISEIVFTKTRSLVSSDFVTTICDYIIWYAKNKNSAKNKMKKLYNMRADNSLASHYQLPNGNLITKGEFIKKESEKEMQGARAIKSDDLIRKANPYYDIQWQGKNLSGNYRTSKQGLERCLKADRIIFTHSNIRYKFFLDDFPVSPISHLWADVIGASNPVYVVQTNEDVIKRCILMTTDPGDIVLDPTCGSGTTAYVAEQWGRRWITIDTSRVSLALARARLMGARYPYYYLADSESGRMKEYEASKQEQPNSETHNDIRQGFVYKRVPHVTLRSIANNAEIDVIYENHRKEIESRISDLNKSLGKNWEEWEIPHEADPDWTEKAKKAHADFWQKRLARQEDIDKSISGKADFEILYDQPYEDNSKIRVSGPFTVESLSPHRAVPGDEDELIESIDAAEGSRQRKDAPADDFTSTIIENLKTTGIHQAAKEDHIVFTSISGWPGKYISVEGHFNDGKGEKRAGIHIGPEFGTVSRADIVAAAREANETRFDVLIACGFNFDAHSTELSSMGPLPILKAKMNQDLHMSEELKNTGKGNLFTIIGEPDIEWKLDDDGNIVVEVLGLDVFDLKTSAVRNSEKDEIAAWFIDTDYDEESFFVRHAYFMGANDPYKSLKASLNADIDKEAWESIYRDTSRPFPKPESGRFAVKVINHFGDEVMKVIRIDEEG